MYRGNLYDVVRKEVLENGDVRYECINDKQETELFVTLDKKVGRQLDARHQGNNPAKTIFSALYFFDIPLINFNEQNFYSFQKYFLYELNYSIPALEINSPPPQNI